MTVVRQDRGGDAACAAINVQRSAAEKFSTQSELQVCCDALVILSRLKTTRHAFVQNDPGTLRSKRGTPTEGGARQGRTLPLREWPVIVSPSKNKVGPPRRLMKRTDARAQG